MRANLLPTIAAVALSQVAVLFAIVLFAAADVAWTADTPARWAGDRSAVLQGHDVVAYHADGVVRRGTGDHTVGWEGGTFHFASAETAERFRSAPRRYAPRFGAYCTGALAQGLIVPADPRNFRVYEGNLYVFAAPGGPPRFDQDPERMLQAARAFAKKVGIVE